MFVKHETEVSVGRTQIALILVRNQFSGLGKAFFLMTRQKQSPLVKENCFIRLIDRVPNQKPLPDKFTHTHTHIRASVIQTHP